MSMQNAKIAIKYAFIFTPLPFYIFAALFWLGTGVERPLHAHVVPVFVVIVARRLVGQPS